MTGSIDRRTLLASASASVIAGNARSVGAAANSAFAIALGGGAARGLAHIPVLEALDDLGITPSLISGTSMGAIIGAVYASGMNGRDIRTFALELFSNRLKTIRRLFPGNPATWGSVLALGNSAALAPEQLMSAALPDIVPETFSELAIPLRIVTTDFYRQEEFVIASGSLHKAIGASAALPVLLSPVQWGERVLIDGGFVNPTPFDILADQPGITVAVDVTGNGNRTSGEIPGGIETWIGSSQIALHSLVNERLKRVEPDLLIRPDVGGFASMEFHRIEEILAAAEQARELTKRKLVEKLDSNG